MASSIIVPFRPALEKSEADEVCRAKIVKTLVGICREFERMMTTEGEQRACREVEGWLRKLPSKDVKRTTRKSARRRRSANQRLS
jgi:hypothetical protein